MIGISAVVVALLFAAGVYAMLSRQLQQVAIGFLLLSNAVNLLLLTSAGLPARARPPLLGAEPVGPYPDPLPQAFVLTAIVIGLGMAAFLLALTLRLYRETGSDEAGGAGE